MPEHFSIYDCVYGHAARNFDKTAIFSNHACHKATHPLGKSVQLVPFVSFNAASDAVLTVPFLRRNIACVAVLIVVQCYAGTVALITINSGAQIHPLIATRWCSSLKGKNLRYVMVANHGYLPDRVNFAARIAKNRANPDIPVDLIASFKAAAETDPGDAIILVSFFWLG